MASHLPPSSARISDASPAVSGHAAASSNWWAAGVFYLGIPGFIALYAALNNWKLLGDLGFLSSLLFYAGHALPWYLTALVSSLVMRILKPWRPGLLVISMLGSVLAGLLTIPYAVWLTHLMAADASMANTGGFDDPLGTLTYLARATLLWIGANLVFDRYLGFPRYRYDASSWSVVPPPRAAAPAPEGADRFTPPAFLARLAKPVPLEGLLALKAEQHYVKVITSAGNELILHRLGDAIRELPQDCGFQVHRSWWVSRRAITQLNAAGRKMTLRLCNGLEIPVSPPYQELVRRLADPGQ